MLTMPYGTPILLKVHFTFLLAPTWGTFLWQLEGSAA